MIKPNGYDNARVSGDFKPLPNGGYVCTIKQVVETKSRKGKDMLVISLDIAEGEYKDFYAKSYRADTRQEKKWGCNVYQLIADNDNNCTSGFKTFITAVERSNPNFAINWSEDEAAFCEQFKNKLVGGLFAREEYEKSMGGTAWTTKCVAFRSADKIRSGDYILPEDKPLKRDAVGADEYYRNNRSHNFAEIEDDGELPF